MAAGEVNVEIGDKGLHVVTATTDQTEGSCKLKVTVSDTVHVHFLVVMIVYVCVWVGNSDSVELKCEKTTAY